jgi:preprotein translocase subunit SecD
MVYGKQEIDMIKYWRIWLLLVFVLAATLAIGFKEYPYGRYGVKVVYVSGNSPAKGILEQGMIITEVNEMQIKNIQDWENAIKNINSGTVSLKANGKYYTFTINNTLGIDVTEMERTNLDFGLDIRGGTRILLKPKGNVTSETLTQTIATLQTRANLYGLKEINFYPILGTENYIQVEAAGIGSEIVDNLLSKQGTFEAKINKTAKIEGDYAKLRLGDDFYQIKILANDTIEFNNTVIKPGEKFTINNIEFDYVSREGNQLNFLAKVYDGDDIEIVYTDPQRSGITPRGNIYFFYFTVSISDEGAKRFADITKGMETYLDVQSGEEYLKGKMILYLDGEQVSELNIGASLAGEVIQTPSIQGSRLKREDAIEDKLQLQTILRSGALPVSLETVSVDIISPRLGSDFFQSMAYSMLLAAIIVVSIVFIRYRSLKIAVPLIFVSLSEVIIILGIAAINDIAIWLGVLAVGIILVLIAMWKKENIDIYAMMGVILIPLLGMLSWTIDLSAIAGVIAAIGTGMDHQIIIADETIRGRTKKKAFLSIKDQIKRAFFIIFGAASTTIAAMIPLLFLGMGMIRGFAITTIIGVLVGILITRPAYARIVEAILEKR